MSEEIEQKVTQLSQRVKTLEKTQETLVDEVIDQVLAMFSTTTKAQKYIPDLKRIDEDLKSFKKNIDADVDTLRESLIAVSQPPVIAPPKGLMSSHDKADLDGIRGKIAILDQQMQEKFAKIDYELKEKLASLNHTINNHPVNSRVDQIEDSLINYVGKDMFRAVQDSLIDFATVETTDVILRRIAKLDDKFLTISDYHMHTDELKLNLDEKFDTKLSITDFNENITQIEEDMGQKMDPISEELESQKKTMKNLKGEFADVIDVTNS